MLQVMFVTVVKALLLRVLKYFTAHKLSAARPDTSPCLLMWRAIPDLTQDIVVSDASPILTAFSDVFQGDLRVAGLKSARVALKRMRPVGSPAYSHRRMGREIAAMILSRHQNVMPVLGILRLRDSAAGPGDVCIVTPWAGGGTLKQYLLAHAADADRVSILREIACGLAYLHTCTANKDVLVHGDIHPGNVLMTEDGHALLSDFGLCDIWPDDRAPAPAPHFLRSGHPVYTAPELHVRGTRRSCASDVFAFGVLAYVVLAGARPFAERSAVGAMLQFYCGRRPTKREGIAADLWLVVSDCWAHVPWARPTMRAVRCRLAHRPARTGAWSCLSALLGTYGCIFRQ